MPSKNPAVAIRQRILDILENIQAIRTFTAGIDFPGFSKSLLVQYAVTRALEIISEASRHLPQDLKERQNAIEWRSIAAAGNVYRHRYDGVDEMFVWDVVIRDLEPLKAALQQEIERLSRDDPG